MADAKRSMHGRGWTEGSSGTHPQSLAGAKGSRHGSAGTAASTGMCVQVLQVRSPSKPKLVHACLAWAHSPQGMGWGGEGGVKPARGWGGSLVLTLLIERDSCLHRCTTVKETALGENNNNKKAPILKTTNTSNTCYPGRGCGGYRAPKQLGKGFPSRLGEGHLFTARKGVMEELVQNEIHDVLLAVPRQLAKSSR